MWTDRKCDRWRYQRCRSWEEQGILGKECRCLCQEELKNKNGQEISIEPNCTWFSAKETWLSYMEHRTNYEVQGKQNQR